MKDENFFKAFVGIWLGVLLVNLILLGVIIWAIVKVVNAHS